MEQVEEVSESLENLSLNNTKTRPSFIFIDDPECDLHKQSDSHMERSMRTYKIREVAKSMSLSYMKNERRASEEELQLVHDEKMIEKARRASKYAGSGYVKLATDIQVNKHSFNAAISAVGAVLTAVDLIMTPDKDYTVFCNVRPPGHHANSSESSGFCIFNNVAIGAVYYTKKYGGKVAIVDWDVHHGNGTQDILKDGNHHDIFYGSIHQSPFYPGTGKKSDPHNRIHNHPMEEGTSFDTYFPRFEELMCRVRAFKPDLIFISCGFDAHRMDPIGGFELKSEDYRKMTLLVRKICPKVISVLEGGYSMEALENASKCHFEAMML